MQIAKTNTQMFWVSFGIFTYLIGQGETALRDSEDSDTPNGTPVLQLTLRYSN
jgi:hypothetical protein